MRFDLAMIRSGGVAGTAEFAGEVNRRAIRGSSHWPSLRGRLGRMGEYLRRGLGPRRVVVDMTVPGPAELDPTPAAWWVGYWQQLRFAQVARDELRELLGLAETERIGEPRRIAVHVRRGDYVGLGLALQPDWYKAATDEALEMVGDAEIRVFSDDTRMVRGFVAADAYPSRLLDWGHSLDDFRSLAQADLMIASASTYSWWAGFLGGGHVHFPQGRSTTSACPQTWTASDLNSISFRRYSLSCGFSRPERPGRRCPPWCASSTSRRGTRARRIAFGALLP